MNGLTMQSGMQLHIAFLTPSTRHSLPCLQSRLHDLSEQGGAGQQRWKRGYSITDFLEGWVLSFDLRLTSMDIPNNNSVALKHEMLLQ